MHCFFYIPLIKSSLSVQEGSTSRHSETDKRDVYVEVTEKGLSLRDKASEIPAKLGAYVPLNPEKTLMLLRHWGFLLRAKGTVSLEKKRSSKIRPH